MDIKKIVIAKISDLGVKEAAKYFGVSTGTISNWSRGASEPSIAAAQLVMNELPGPREIEQIKDDVEEFIEEQCPDYDKNNPVISWEGREVMLMLPVYRTFNAETFFTLFCNYAKYGPSKMAMEMVKRTVIHEARNMLIDKGMKVPGIKTFIQIDDDMVIPCGIGGILNGRYGAGVTDAQASLLTFDRLMASGSDKGIVGMNYFGRHAHGQCQNALGMGSHAESDKFRRGEHKGLVAVDWVATGGIKIERWVIEKMKAHIDAGNWPECKPTFEGSWYGYFNPQAVRIGEDVSFGRRAKEIGIQSYVDADLIALHCGDCYYGPKNTSS